MVWVSIIIFAATFAIAGLAALALRTGGPTVLEQRLLAVVTEQISAPVAFIETDIRRPEERKGWLDLPSLRLLLYQADMTAKPETLLLTAVSGWLFLSIVFYWKFDQMVPALALAGGFLPMPLFYVRRRRTTRLEKVEQQLPEALDMLVSALRVGHSMISAIGSLAQNTAEPISREFRTVFEEQNFGADLRTSMKNFAERVPLQDLRMFVAATLIQKETGGNLAEILEKVAEATRERFRLKKQIAIHTAPGRITGMILSVFPIILGTGMYISNPETMRILWTRPEGLRMLYAAIGLIVVGSLVIRKIVRIRV